jgi:hypothetical protein
MPLQSADVMARLNGNPCESRTTKGLLRIALRRLRSIAQGCAVCLPLRDPDFERNHDVTPPARGPATIADVQFWETENRGRLDRSHRGSHRRDIPCLVDASNVRTLNAFNLLRRGQRA